jgi:hypothetical protein
MVWRKRGLLADDGGLSDGENRAAVESLDGGKVMKLYLSSHLKDEGGRLRGATATAGAVLLVALVPVSAVLALALSTRARRALAGRFMPVGRVPDVERRLAFAWMAGFVLVMVGQAAGAAAGPLSMFDPVGLVAHTLFGLCGEMVMAAATILVVCRGRIASSTPIDG